MNKQTGTDGVLFANVVIERVDADPAGEQLNIRAVCGERDHMAIAYGEMFYSQFSDADIGSRIAYARLLPPGELPAWKNDRAFIQFADECKSGSDLTFIKTLAARGHDVILHYMADGGLRLVIAKKIDLADL